MNKYILYCFLFFQYAFAQNTSIEINLKNDSIRKEYIGVTRHKLQFKIDYNTDAQIYTFQKNDINQNYELAPNQKANLRFSVNYKIIGFAYSISPSTIFGYDEGASKGQTKSTGMTLNLNFKKFQQRFTYSNTKGYYIANTDDFRELLHIKTPYFLLKDFKTTVFESQTMYFFNHNKYSYKLARTQNEVQKKSAGSLVLPFEFKYMQIDGRNEDNSKFVIDDNFVKFPKKYDDYFLNTGVGYGYNFVYHSWYIAGMIVPMIGVNYNKILTINNDKLSSSSFVYGQISEFSAGYNTSSWFGGIFLNGSTSYLKNANRSYSENYTFASLFLGYRFNTPKIVKKVDAEINNFFKRLFTKKKVEPKK